MMNIRRKTSRWFLLGLVAGLAVWAVGLRLMGDPGIPYVVTPVEGQGSRVLVGQVGFHAMADWSLSTDPEVVSVDDQADDIRLVEAAIPVMEALHIPEVQEMLGVTMPEDELESAKGISRPDTMVPGSPSASMVQVVNRSTESVMARIRPEIILQADNRLCEALKVVITVVQDGLEPQVVDGGTMADLMNPEGQEIMLTPGKQYDLAVLVSTPKDLDNSYQGTGCTVTFMMDTEAI